MSRKIKMDVVLLRLLGSKGKLLGRDHVCDVDRRLDCGGGPMCEYDPAKRPECRDCLLALMYEVFEKEASGVLEKRRLLSAARTYGEWIDGLRDFLAAKTRLHLAAVEVVGHAQLHGVLDPYVSREVLAEPWLERALREGILQRMRDDLYGPVLAPPNHKKLFGTKAFNDDMF